MDDLEQDELEGIWERSKTLIDTSKIKSTSKEGIIAELGAAIKEAAKSNPRLEGLVRGNFAKNGVDIVKQSLGIVSVGGGIKEVKPMIALGLQAKLRDILKFENVVKVVLGKELVRADKRKVISRVDGVSFSKSKKSLLIETSRGDKRVSSKNLLVKIGMVKRKPTAYFYKKNSGKLISKKKLK
jgi:hypothetical protein